MAVLLDAMGRKLLDSMGRVQILADGGDPSTCTCCGPAATCVCDTTTPRHITHWAYTVAGITICPSWTSVFSPGDANGSGTIVSSGGTQTDPVTHKSFCGASFLYGPVKTVSGGGQYQLGMAFDAGGNVQISILQIGVGNVGTVFVGDGSVLVSCGGSRTLTNLFTPGTFFCTAETFDGTPGDGYNGTVTITPLS